MSTSVLVDTSSVKFYTGITTTTNDDLITTLIPIVLDDINYYTKNYFIKSTAVNYDSTYNFSTGNNIYLNSTDITKDWSIQFKAGDTIRIVGSKWNDFYYSLSTVASTYITTNESVVSESTCNSFVYFYRVIFPRDLPLIASKMVNYLINSQQKTDIRSESLGDYSVSYTDIGGNAYPTNIAKSLNKYRMLGMK